MLAYIVIKSRVVSGLKVALRAQEAVRAITGLRAGRPCAITNPLFNVLLLARLTRATRITQRGVESPSRTLTAVDPLYNACRL